ncbi:hypothetical protein M2272_005527 [Mycobacterium frederiksbergense]|uniref:DUF732 domain-containing protein n=1 Tax=Mycolicibacterium frederiksbergense TaxID=117567 RepID=A0ABT6L7D4_9MYCO|nr:hypothetical protein [Mycolicibacterium frederiksbergense]
MSTTTRKTRPTRAFGVITSCLTGVGIAVGLLTAPPASADNHEMVRCFIAHGIVDRAAITIGNWHVGDPLIDPPGGIDRDNWFRVYGVCTWLVHRTNIF